MGPVRLVSHNPTHFVRCRFPLAKDCGASGQLCLRLLRCSFLSHFYAFCILLWPVCSGNCATFFLAFPRIYNGDWSKKVSRESAP